MDAIDDAVIGPKIEVVEDRALRRKVLRHVAPLAARAQNVHQAIGNLPHVDRPLATPVLGGGNQRLNQRPFLIRQIARVAKRVTLVASAVLGGPHQHGLPRRATFLESHPIPATQQVFGRTLSLIYAPLSTQ